MNQETKAIRLVNGGYAIVDATDYETLWPYDWRRTSHGGAARVENRRTVYMHRQIMGFPPRGMDVDHVNGNRLDNRRSNLRVCSRSHNQANAKKVRGETSQFKGVYRRISSSGKERWVANVCYRGVRICKDHPSELEAAIWYDRKAREVFGEFASTNNIDAARKAER